MTSKTFIGVFVTMVILIMILVLAAAWYLNRRKRRSSKAKDPESANIGREHVEFANNTELRNMQAPRAQPATRRSLDISAQEPVQPHGAPPRSTSVQWRRRGFEFSASTPAVIPEEANARQATHPPRPSHGSATPIADSFIRQSRIGLAQTTPCEGSSSPRPRPRLSLNTLDPRHVEVEDTAGQSTPPPAPKEHPKSPEDQWDNIDLSPPPPQPSRQSMQSNGSSLRGSFESSFSERMPASWGRALKTSRFALD